MSYEQVRDLVLSRGDVERGVGATDGEVREAERVLGSLPQDYRSFLAEFGWIDVGPQAIFGLGADVADYLNVATMTLQEREDGGLPPHLIAVQADGGGNFNCIDTAAVAAGREVMVFWAHDDRPGIAPAVVGNSFSDWLIDLVRDIE